MVASLMALVALSIDTVLPAMNMIKKSFDVYESQGHWVITCLFLGLSCGQLIFGPLSDSLGRKPIVYMGLLLFILGNIVSILSPTYEIFLFGRLLQGFGAAGPSIATRAIVRDMTSGDEMARLMSFVMSIFILIPVFAPTLGQLILWNFSWHYIFLAMTIISFALGFWFYFSQPETLKISTSFSTYRYASNIVKVFGNSITIGCTVSAGLTFGMINSFLIISQPLLQNTYHIGDGFAFYFGSCALFIFIASLVNAKIVIKLGANVVVSYSLLFLFLWSLLFLVISITMGSLKLTLFTTFIIPTFFLFGTLFGNLNAMAMTPMGHLAGTASSVIGTGTTIIGLIIGTIISNLYNADPTPFIILIFSVSIINSLILYLLKKLSLSIALSI